MRLQQAHARRPAAPSRFGAVDGRGARAGRVLPPRAAEVRRGGHVRAGRRGARALEASRRGHRGTRRVHPAVRAERVHPAARRVRVRERVPRPARPPGRRAARGAHLGERVAAASASARFPAHLRAHQGRVRHSRRAVRAGAHGEHRHRGPARRVRHHGGHAPRWLPPRHRRFRLGAIVAQRAEGPARRRAEARPRVPAGELASRHGGDGGALRHHHGSGAAHGNRHGGRGDAQAAGVPPHDRVRHGAGLRVLTPRAARGVLPAAGNGGAGRGRVPRTSPPTSSSLCFDR